MNLVENRKARRDYTFLEEFEAGIKLLGHEVRSLRVGGGKLDGSHVIVRGNEAYIVGMGVRPYQPVNTPENYDPERTRKLMLNSKEILELAAAESQKGLTIIPISLYNKGRNLKVRIAIAKGKKEYDKREALKERDSKREIARSLKTR